MNKKIIFKKIIASCVVGFINGFFGGGGGLLCVVALKNIYKLETKKAHATTLAVIFPISIISAIIYSLNNHIEILSTSFISFGVIIGGILGALILKKINQKVVNWVFIAVLFTVGIKMIL